MAFLQNQAREASILVQEISSDIVLLKCTRAPLELAYDMVVPVPILYWWYGWYNWYSWYSWHTSLHLFQEQTKVVAYVVLETEDKRPQGEGRTRQDDYK